MIEVGFGPRNEATWLFTESEEFVAMLTSGIRRLKDDSDSR
jgi:hypothetical protein